MELSNVSKKKKKKTIECDKNTVICDIGIAQELSNMTKQIRVPPNVTKVRSKVMLVLHNVRIELSNMRKKIKEPLNVTRELSHVMLELHNVRMEPSNMRKNKGTAKCDKRTVTCDVGTAQYEDETVKCEDLVTWYNILPTSGYRTPQKIKGVW